MVISTWCYRNGKSTTEYMMRSAAVLYLLQIQTPFHVLWSGSLCKVIQPVCISPASGSTMPEREMGKWLSVEWFERGG